MSESDNYTVAIGADVYNDEKEKLGTIRGLTNDGFVVTTEEGVEALSVEHERSSGEFGEAELMWRCSDCGEMGQIEDIPDQCPNCGADKTALYYWTED